MTEQQRRGATQGRQAEIVRLLRSGRARVEDIAKALGVSPSTVRRDLAALESQGALARTYGGAMSQAPFKESRLGDRVSVAVDAKDAIGRAAAEWVTDGSTIFVDAGSTCARLVEHVRDRRNLTVVTRGLEIAMMLAESPVEVIVVGGRVSPKSHGLAGAITMFVMERLSVDVAFLGCDALDPTRGVGEPTLEEAATKEMIARGAHDVVVLAHGGKLVQERVPSWARLPHGWNLVTDETDEQVLGPYRAAGVNVRLA